MLKFEFTPNAQKEFGKLPMQIQTQIERKLKYWSAYENPLDFADWLTTHPLGTHRLRIGDYRLICKVENQKISITRVGDRKNVY